MFVNTTGFAGRIKILRSGFAALFERIFK